MPNRKLLEVLQCLAGEDRKRLALFVKSDYHNQKYNKEKTIQLLHLLLKKIEDGSIGQLEKAELNTHFFPRHSYKARGKNPIDTLASDLFSLIRRFLLFEHITSKDNRRQELLAMAQFYRKNNIPERFEQTIRKFRALQRHSPTIDDWEMLENFQMEEEVAVFQSIFNRHTGDGNQVAVHTALDTFYVLTKLEITCSLLYQQKLGQLQENQSFVLTDAIVQHFHDYEAIQNPLAKLYLQIIAFLKDTPSKSELEEFKNKLDQHQAVIPPEKLRNLVAFYRYFMGLQYQLQTGSVTLIRNLFALYKAHLQQGYFHVEGDKILPGSLKVMVNFALKLGENQWAQDLLRAYPPERITGTRFPQEFYSLCLAEVLFSEKKYSKAHHQLEYRNFGDINFSILADILLIKIYYTTDHELLDSRIRALEQKVRRSRLSTLRKTPYLNFLKVMYKVLKQRHDRTSKKWKKIGEQTRELPSIIEREWLLNEVLTAS